MIKINCIIFIFFVLRTLGLNGQADTAFLGNPCLHKYQGRIFLNEKIMKQSPNVTECIAKPHNNLLKPAKKKKNQIGVSP